MNFAAVLGGCLIAALPLAGYAVQEQNAVETVRIGIYQNQPKVFLDQAGDPAGFWVDLLEHIADAEDWSLEYVPCQWYRCLEAVEEGQLDLMVDVAYSEERDRSFDFNQEVVLASWSVVYARSGLRLDSMLDLDQKRVAVLKGSIQYAALAERTRAFGVRPKFVEVADFGEMFRLINNGDVDAGVVNRFFGMEAASRYKVFKTNILVRPSRLHFIAPQGKQGELLATLDLHLKDLAADSNSAYYQALERWLEPEGRFGWVQVKHILIDLAVYAPLVSLAAVIVWNRFLSREVHRRKQAEALLRESEQRYSTLVAAVPVGIFRADAGGNCTYVNDRWCQITGLSPEASMGKGWAKGLHPDDRDLVATEWYQSAQENRLFQLEYRFQRPDGKVTWVYGQSVAERDADGQVVGYVGSITDISDRKRAEDHLRESEQRFRLAIANAPFPIMLHAEDGEVLQINATWTELTGYTQQDIPTTQAWAQRAYGDRATTVLENVIAKKYALESRWDEGEFTVTTSDSQQRIWNFSSAPLGLLPDGRRVVISMAADVTQRRQAEAALRDSEERYRSIYDQAAVGLANGSLDGKFLNVNPRFCKMLGYSREELLTKTVLEITHPEDRTQILPAAQRLFTGEVSYFFQEKRYLRKNGSCFWSSTGVSLVRDAAGNPKHTLAVIRDISDRKQAEAALWESEARWQFALEGAGDGVWDWNAPTNVVFFSRQWKAMLGYAENEIGNTLEEWDSRVHPDDKAQCYDELHKHFRGEIPMYQNEHRVRCKDGSYKWILARGKVINWTVDGQPLRVIGTHTDIRDRKQAEAALRESEQRFRNMAENVPGAIFKYVLHPDGSDGVIYMSRGCYGLWEVEAEAVVEDAQVLWEMVHPDDRPALYKSVITSARTLQPWFWQWRIITPSGQVKWLEAAGRPEHHENGDVVWDTLILDVSDRKQAEAALRESEVRYRKVVEAQTDFILRSLPDTTITFANKALCQALGNSLEDIVGKKRSDFANPDDLQESVFRRLAELSPTNPRFVVETWDNRADGQVGWTQWLNEGIFDQSGQLVEIQSVGRDITKLKQVEQALRESEERLRLVTENMSDLVCLHHPNGHYLYVTPSSQALLGYCPEELIGRDPYELFHPDKCDQIRQEAHELAWNDIPSPITYRIRKKTGEYIWLETLTQPILDEDGQVKHWQTTSRDVSDRVKVEEQLKHDALHDGLTGLPNRSLLMERLDLALKRAKRHPEFQCAVLFLDLDNFKVVNDSLGHIVGDEMLLEVATQLMKFIRETDVAARLGGDEFVILLEEIDGIEEAVRVAERILAALRSPLQVADREVFTSTSIGIVAGTTSHHCAEDLLRDADLAMYRAKHSGRGQYAIFDPPMHLQVVQRLHLEHDLRQALENREFVLYYQPIVNLKTQLIQGFEVLIRWQHPQRGFVSPGEFIEIAEETGLIVPIGQWILHTACQQLAAWQAQFPAKPLRISVNLSVKQLQSLLLQQLEEVLTSYSLQDNSLVLEITESMLVQNVEATCNLLNQVKAKGICLSIDDFGTGYSSLSYLHQLPVDALKIDRTFVSLAGPDARNQVIAESIIALSNLLGLNAIAEGVETPQQLQWLKGLGCELAQGFLFSPPVPATQATELLKRTLPSLPYRGS